MINEGVRSLTSNLDKENSKIKHFSHKIVLVGFSLEIKKLRIVDLYIYMVTCFTPYRHNYTERFYNKIAATLVFQTNPVGVELFPL